MADAVLCTIDDGIATITLNQPDRRNPFSAEIKHGMGDAIDTLDDTVRCVAVEGAGSAFSAGGDIHAMQERFDTGVLPDERARELEPAYGIVERLYNLPVPTVAKVDGAAVGAGATLALACDIQLASDRALFGIVFKNVGLSVDAGTSYFLPRILGTNTAKELAFTGELVDADRALELGLVNHVFPQDEFEAETAKIIETIANGPTVALRHSKRLIDQGLGATLEEAMRNEAIAGGVVYATDDHREGVRAFLESRDPEFTGQ